MNIQDEINNAIVDFLIKTIREPLIYFSEADLQQMLVEKLGKIKSLSKLYPTSVKKGKDSKSVYKTSLIHREYGSGEGRRFDVVIFDKDSVGAINNINLTKGKEYLKPIYAFELGTEKSTDTKTHFGNDLKKLKNCKESGYLIHIYKDVTTSKSGTASREKTEEKIKLKFKDVFNKNISKQNVKILAVLLRVYRAQSKIVGKCELFSNGEWVKINISSRESLSEQVLKQLKYS